MDLAGRYEIPASPETVWAGINDPEVLKQCIPGCQSLDKTDDTHFEAAVKLKIGPVAATFKGKVALEDLDPPTRCVLKGEGQGGVAGFAKGEAEVLLAPEGAGTVLTYAAKANVGGKLAQIGQRLVQGAAKQIADEFFAKFAEIVSQPAEPAGDTAPVPGSAADQAAEQAEAMALAESEAVGVPMEPMASEAYMGDSHVRLAAEGGLASEASEASGRPPSRREGVAPEIWVVGLVGVIVILLILFGLVL